MKLDTHVRQGLIDSIPVAISFFFVFSSLGALYQGKGIQFIETVMGTALIFAAPLQVSGVEIISNGQVVAGVALTLLINFRFLFMSMVTANYFVGVSRARVLCSMLMFSASTYAVTHYHLKSSGIRDGASQFRYYLGVSVPSYLVAVIATICGFILSSRIDYSAMEIFMVMILPIHFTALTARNSGQGLTVPATVVGGLCAPLLMEVDTLWLTVGLPLVVGLVLAALDTNSKR